MHPYKLASVLALAALASCGGDFGETGDGDGSGGGNGSLRLVNASSRGFLDLYQSSTALSSSVPQSGAGSYVIQSRGNRTFGIRESGDAATLATATVLVARDDHQALVAYRSAGALQTAVLSEDEPVPTNNNAKLRIFNSAQGDAGSVDVYLVAATTTCAGVAADTTEPRFGNVTAAPTTFTQIAATTAAQRVCVTGVGDRTNLRFDIPSLVLTNQRIVTLVLTRTPAGALQALTIDQQDAVAAIAGTAPTPIP